MDVEVDYNLIIGFTIIGTIIITTILLCIACGHLLRHFCCNPQQGNESSKDLDAASEWANLGKLSKALRKQTEDAEAVISGHGLIESQGHSEGHSYEVYGLPHQKQNQNQALQYFGNYHQFVRDKALPHQSEILVSEVGEVIHQNVRYATISRKARF